MIGLWATAERVGATLMTRGRTISSAVAGLLVGVLAGFAVELLRRQPADRVQQRYVAPPASGTRDASRPAPGPEPAAG